MAKRKTYGLLGRPINKDIPQNGSIDLRTTDRR